MQCQSKENRVDLTPGKVASAGKFVMVNLVYMSQRMVLLKVIIVIISLNNICFCMPMGKSLRKSEIAWFLTSRTLQLRGRDNTCTYLQIINGKWMGNPFNAQRSKGKNWG